MSRSFMNDNWIKICQLRKHFGTCRFRKISSCEAGPHHTILLLKCFFLCHYNKRRHLLVSGRTFKGSVLQNPTRQRLRFQKGFLESWSCWAETSSTFSFGNSSSNLYGTFSVLSKAGWCARFRKRDDDSHLCPSEKMYWCSLLGKERNWR